MSNTAGKWNKEPGAKDKAETYHSPLATDQALSSRLWASRISRRRFLADSLKTGAAFLLLPWLRHRRTPNDTFVQSLWSGALTPTTIRVNAKLTRDSDRVRLLVSTSSAMSNPIFSAFGQARQTVNGRMASLAVAGLQPNTDYFYRIEADGVVDMNQQGRFHTPGTGPYSFTFAFASCAHTGSAHPVFTTIRQHNPLFFVHMGDLHYRDIAQNDRQVFRDAFDMVLASSTQAALYRHVPLAYMWDDHDYGPNDSDKTSPSRPAARLTYQEYVPHYPLVAGSGNVPIYQAFTIGRVRFILTDTRSERDTAAVDPNNPSKSILGTAQKAWFKQELLNAQGQYPVIVWLSTSPWIADSPGSGIDNWNGFRAERREIADFIKANNVQGVHMISGDVHMLGIDDGRYNSYGSDGQRSFPIMQAAALDQGGSFFTSNTYSEGQYPGGGQFGLMTITDTGTGKVRILWSGRNAANDEIVRLELTAPPSPRLLLDRTDFGFVANPQGTPILEQTLTIANEGIGNMPWQLVADPNVPWLAISLRSGTLAQQTAVALTLTANPSGLPLGTYQTELHINAASATNAPQTVHVQLLHTHEDSTYLPISPNA